MTTVNIDGIDYPAYALLMRKENALRILKGEKTVETRFFTDRYAKMFIDPQKEQKRKEKLKDKANPADFESVCRNDVAIIHFYSTGAPWTLDVEIDELDICDLTEEGLDFLNERFGFDEFDDERGSIPKTYRKGKTDSFFYAHIVGILKKQGL